MASVHVILKYVHQTKISGGCQSGRKLVPHNYKSDLPLVIVNLDLYFSKIKKKHDEGKK